MSDALGEFGRAAFLPVSFLWGAVSKSRNLLYDRGIARVQRLSVPVVSIGNITAGGTGKTPLTIHLARILLAAGERPLVLSRGYRSGGSGTRVVSDGTCVVLGPAEAGDEPVLIARSVKGLPVVVDPDRLRGGRMAVVRFGPSVILLDDGYQHRRLARDLDIVLLNALDPFGRYAMLPSGLLREPFRGLARADLFVLTHAPDEEPLETLHAVVRRFNARAPLLRARHRAEGLLPLPQAGAQASGPEPLGRIHGARVYAFCAIGNPEGFRETLLAAGAHIAGFETFRDHHPVTAADAARLVRAASRAEADLIVTTEKDAVRLPALDTGPPAYALRIRMEITPEAELTERVLAVVRAGRS